MIITAVLLAVLLGQLSPVGPRPLLASIPMEAVLWRRRLLLKRRA